jgi:hypothetical protein
MQTAKVGMVRQRHSFDVTACRWRVLSFFKECAANTLTIA